MWPSINREVSNRVQCDMRSGCLFEIHCQIIIMCHLRPESRKGRRMSIDRRDFHNVITIESKIYWELL